MLHVPVGGNTFGVTQNSGPTRPASTYGLSVTPSNSGKSAWVQLLEPTTSDSYGIMILVNTNASSSTNRNTVLDIGVDENGGTSYEVKIPDLICGHAISYAQGGVYYYFPLYIKAGCRIGVRARASTASSLRVACQLFQRPLNPANFRLSSFVEAYGISGASGVSLTPGTTSEGAWVNVGTTQKRVWWWQFGMQVAVGDTSHVTGSYHVDVAVGDATVKDIIIQDAPYFTTNLEDASNPPLTMGMEYVVPAGVNVYVRAQGSVTTADIMNVAVYAAGG